MNYHHPGLVTLGHRVLGDQILGKLVVKSLCFHVWMKPRAARGCKKNTPSGLISSVDVFSSLGLIFESVGI